MREALTARVGENDIESAKRKLAALAQRPLRDGALVRWARCVGAPYALPDRAGKTPDDVSLARLESWRAAAHGLGRVAFAVAAPAAIAEEVATAIARGPAWSPAPSPSRRTIRWTPRSW